MEIFLASLAIFSGWLIYRWNLINENKKNINALDALLKIAGGWFSTPYPQELEDRRWFYPGKSVYKVDISLLPSIINSNIIDKKLSRQLSYFMQLVARFNHDIDVYNAFKYSDTNLFLQSFDFYRDYLSEKDYYQCFRNIENFERTNDAKKELLIKYCKYLYTLQKNIHVNGIGTMGNFDNSSFPQLNKCFHDTRYLLELEKNYKRGFFKDRFAFMFGDFLFLIVPGILIALALVKGYYFFNPCIKCFLGRII